ncbi:MAG: M23 family metallopeptidase [Crocinitomicaceae bacterium]|nr:M23 family metallopeptidase [Crocinitomicaceae bacterium]
MSKQQYKYNPDNLSYEEVKVSLGRRVLKMLLFIAPSLVVGLLLSLFFTRQIDSPSEKRLLADLDLTKVELERLQDNMALCNEVLDVIEGRDEDLYRNVLYADEFPEELRRMGTGGSDKYEHLKGVTNDELLRSTSNSMDKLEKRLNAQSMSFRELLKLVKNKEKMITCIPSIQPVRNSDLKRAISGFGWRIDPIYKTRHMHTGMDFTAKRGTDVHATGDGYVEEIENKRWGYGKCIIINHGYGYKTRYAHLSGFKVKKGDKIKRGQLIGLVGSTGRSTGPHLHYEVEKNGEKVNPIGYYHSDLTPAQYEELLKASENSHKALD